MSEVDAKPKFREIRLGELRHNSPMLPLADGRLVSTLTVRELRLLLQDVVPLTEAQKEDVRWHADVKALRAEHDRMRRAHSPRLRKRGTESPVPPELLAASTRRVREVDHAQELERARSQARASGGAVRPWWVAAIVRLRRQWRKLDRMTRP